MSIKLLLTPVLAVAFAAVVRVGTDPMTVTRTVGQQVAVNVTLISSSVQASSVVDIGYDAAVMTPRIPGGAVNGVTVTVPTPGTLRVAWAGTTPPADNTVIYGAVFDCIKPTTGTKLTIRSMTASDASGVALTAAGASDDTLVIVPKPLMWRLLLQP